MALSNLTLLFWGKDLDWASRPPWYIFLNPIWSATFFIGVVLILRSKRSPWSLFTLGLIPVLLAPGLTSITIEPFRTTPAMPLIFLVSVVGGIYLLDSIPRARYQVFLLLILISTVFDSYYLWGPYHCNWGKPTDLSKDSKSVEFWKAYPLLRDMEEREGPGVIFTDFTMRPFDQTLTLACYSFDWLRNPSLDRQFPRWLAVFANPHFMPLLEKRFPEGREVWLSADMGRPDGGLSVFFIESKDMSADLRKAWLRANQGFRDLTLSVIYQMDKRPPSGIMKDVYALHPLVKGNPFLESCFWQKLEFNYVLTGNLDGALEAVRSGLAVSGENAFFYEQMGLIYLKKGDEKRARFFLEKAVKCRLNLTPARINLV